MRDLFLEQLELLHEQLINMGILCEQAIDTACRALTTGDKHLAKEAKRAEIEIDRMERAIESRCMKLLLRQAPMAQDLRTVSSALKMISDMERIGDQAEDIADLAIQVDCCERQGSVHIETMAKATVKMLKDSIDSFVKNDLELARKVMAADDEVDELFTTVKKELIEMISNDPNCGEATLDLLMVAKYLERIGDHATNIAEWVEFCITGTRPADVDNAIEK